MHLTFLLCVCVCVRGRYENGKTKKNKEKLYSMQAFKMVNVYLHSYYVGRSPVGNSKRNSRE